MPHFCRSLSLVLMTIFCSVAAANPGDLDPTFANNGRLEMRFTPGTSYATDWAYQTVRRKDGSLVLISTNEMGWDPLVLVNIDRLGNLKRDFGNGGVVKVTRTPGNGNRPFATVRLADDSFIVGACQEQFEFIKFFDDGQLDLNFGVQGHLIVTGFDWIPDGGSMKVGPDGSLFIGGANANHAFVMKVTPSGALDKRFGVDGIATLDRVSNSTTHAFPDEAGRVIVFHSLPAGSNPNGILMTRLLPDGSVDTSFGFAGKVSYTRNSHALLAKFVLPQGRDFIVTSDCKANGSTIAGMCALRLHDNGMIDRDFGVDGLMYYESALGSFFGLYGAASFDGEGRILLAKSIVNSQTGDQYQAVLRLLPDGKIDTAFGNSGVSSHAETSLVTAATVDGDGITLSGYIDKGYGGKAFAVRLLP